MLRSLMRALRTLMSAPKFDDFFEVVIKSQHISNEETFEQTAKYWAYKYAGG